MVKKSLFVAPGVNRHTRICSYLISAMLVLASATAGAQNWLETLGNLIHYSI